MDEIIIGCLNLSAIVPCKQPNKKIYVIFYV
jgi:hypothetical protein